MRRIPWFAILVLVAGISYGFVSPIVKAAYDHGMSPQDITSGQYVVGAILLWLTSIWWPRGHKMSRRQWLLLFLLGAIGAAASYAYYESLRVLPASIGIVLLFQFSWMVLLADIVVTRKMPAPRQLLGMIVIVAGTFLAVGLSGHGLGAIPIWALALGLLSAVLYAATLYLSGYIDAGSSPAIRTAIVTTVSAVLILPTFYPKNLSWHLVVHGLWYWILLVAVLSQALPVLLMIVAIPKTGGRMAGVLGSIELPIAVMASNLMLGESVSSLRWLGVGMILIGIVVSEWPPTKAENTVKQGIN